MSEFNLDLELTEEVKESFRIDSLEKLSWAFRKLSEATAKKNEVEELKKAEIERINNWAYQENKKNIQAIMYFEGIIQDYHVWQLHADPKKKTISTPYGKVSSTTRKNVISVDDVNSLAEYLDYNKMDEYLLLQRKVDWVNLKKQLQVIETPEGKKVVDENGQIVVGLKLEDEVTTFSVKVE